MFSFQCLDYPFYSIITINKIYNIFLKLSKFNWTVRLKENNQFVLKMNTIELKYFDFYLMYEGILYTILFL